VIVYRPARGFSGVDHFTYVTKNSGGRASARVTVDVLAASQTLPNTGASITSSAEDALALIISGGLLAAITRRQRRDRGAHT
jgi:hypothetical protein